METVRRFIKVRQLNNEETSFKVAIESITVAELKAKIHRKHHIPGCNQRLLYAGDTLEDERTLWSYGISKGAVIHLIQVEPVKAAPNPVPTLAANASLATVLRQIFVHSPAEDKYITLRDIPIDTTVTAFKDMIEAAGFHTDDVRLMAYGRDMYRDTLAENGITNETTIQVVYRLRGS